MVDADLTILEAFADDPTLSQRQLAERAGLPLSKAHFILRRLMEKGLVKVRRAAQSRHKLGYVYLLTPRGIDAKARLTYRFLERAAADYQRMRIRVEAAIGAAVGAAIVAAVPAPSTSSRSTSSPSSSSSSTSSPSTSTPSSPASAPSARSPLAVCILGDGPLGEVVRDVLTDHPTTELVPTAAQAQLAVVVDPDAEQDTPGITYVRLA